MEAIGFLQDHIDDTGVRPVHHTESRQERMPDSKLRGSGDDPGHSLESDHMVHLQINDISFVPGKGGTDHMAGNQPGGIIRFEDPDDMLDRASRSRRSA